MADTLLLLSARARAIEPSLNDNEIAPLSLNQDGRLRVAGKPSLFPQVTGSLTTAGSAAANVVAVDVTDCSNVVYSVKNTGGTALSAGVFIFEASLNSTDGVDGDWVQVQAARSNSNTIENQRGASALAANTNEVYSWEASVNAYRWFRVRCTTSVNSGAIMTWTIGRGSYATEPIPALQAHAVTGSGNFAVTPGSTTRLNSVGVAATTGALVKSTAGNLMELSLFNPTGATIYFKLYDKSSAPVASSDSASLIATIEVPAGKDRIFEFGLHGKRFASGIGYLCTAGMGNSDNTAPGAAGLGISATFV